MRTNAGATLWGFAEATLFFIVPDVYLTVVGLSNVRRALLACLYALIGAMIGGAVMYIWGMRDAAGALRALDLIPAISPGMLDRVRADLLELGPWGVPLGPLFGVPYKTFAVQAGAVEMGLLPFMLITIPARLVRFVLTATLLPLLVNRGLARRGSFRRRLIILLSGWALFYAFYFWTMPN